MSPVRYRGHGRLTGLSITKGLPFGLPKPPPISQTLHHHARHHATATRIVPCLEAPDLQHAQHPAHVGQVAEQLLQKGMLKITLRFADPSSQYLQLLLRSLHLRHGHRLPISHSATRGWFWDVRPSESNFQAAGGQHQARSETMENFPWHTDCSYEDPPPRFFALQVLQHDRRGGGTLSVMSVDRLSELLSEGTRDALMRPEYRIEIPPEFIKDPVRRHIVGSVLFSEGVRGEKTTIRFREDILTPLTDEAKAALGELKEALRRKEVQSHSTVHLTSGDLPKGSIILMDNRRWLHARNNINDPERHLRRVRWDAVPFEGGCGQHTGSA